jgi:hypothetical protein
VAGFVNGCAQGMSPFAHALAVAPGSGLLLAKSMTWKRCKIDVVVACGHVTLPTQLQSDPNWHADWHGEKTELSSVAKRDGRGFVYKQLPPQTWSNGMQFAAQSRVARQRSSPSHEASCSHGAPDVTHCSQPFEARTRSTKNPEPSPHPPH